MEDSKKSQRRQFLKNGALAGLAAGAVGLTNAKILRSGEPVEPPKAAKPEDTEDLQDYKPYGVRSVYETWGRKFDGGRAFPAKRLTPLEHLVGTLTPAAVHFVASHSVAPNTDPKEYRLLIYGMVDRPLSYSLDELKRLPSVTEAHFLECNANSKVIERKTKITAQDIHGRTSCSEWTGVPLSLLLKEAGLQKGAKWLVSDGADSMHYSYDLPLAKAMEDCFIAYGQNGEAIRPEQGYPCRLFVPGFEGPYNVKWLRQIKVVDQPYITKTQAIEHAYNRPDLKGKALWFYYNLPPKSLILRPSGGQQLVGQGYYEITGLAWSGGGAVRRVEVSTNGGKTWKDARLVEPVRRMAHTRFNFDWTWDGQEAMLMSRCTDDQGIVQPSLDEMDKSWGIESRDYWRSEQAATDHGPFHTNAIQPWRVDKDGSVHNAMLTA